MVTGRTTHLNDDYENDNGETSNPDNDYGVEVDSDCTQVRIREAAKKSSYFSGPTTKRGGGGG